MKIKTLGVIFDKSTRQVVDSDHTVADSYELLSHMRPDEP